MDGFPGLRRIFRLPASASRVGEDVDAELAFHVEERVRELVAAGRTEEEARAEALAGFSDLDATRAELRRLDRERVGAERRAEWWRALAQDARHALRGLRKRPGLALVVALTLGIGVGANATMFGILDRVLLEPPPHIANPERVRRIYFKVRFGGEEYTQQRTSYPDYEAVRDGARGFEALAASSRGSLSLGSGTSAEKLTDVEATANYFEVLGTKPVLGRFFTAAEAGPQAARRVAVLSWGLWQRRFGGANDALGQQIRLNGDPYTVIGVAPRGFTGPDLERVDLWIPLGTATIAIEEWSHSRNWYWLSIIGRLKPGVDPGVAEAQATAAYRAGRAAWREEQVAAGKGSDGAFGPGKILLGPVLETRGPEAPPEAKIAAWLGGVSLVVLLIACANVANLLLAHAISRRREIAVRLALGVGRRRLVTQLLTESLVLAAAGGAAGLALTWWGAAALRRLLLLDVAWEGAPVDGPVLLFALGAVLFTGIVTGLVPALQASSPDLSAALKSGVREGTHRRSRTRTALLVTQAALCTLLLVGAGLFVRSLHRVTSQDLGMDLDHVLVAWVNPGASLQRDPADQDAFYLAARERLAAVPGVTRTAIGRTIPFRSSYGAHLSVEGRDSLPRFDDAGPYVYSVSPGYLATVGTRVLRGRPFNAGDVKGSARVAIVGETFARTVWPGQDPIGKCVRIGEPPQPCTTVVGVAADIHREEMEPKKTGIYYVPFTQAPDWLGPRAVFLRTATPAAGLALPVRQALESVRPGLPYADVHTLADLVAPGIRPWRLGATMFTIFGAMALLLAAVGLYSVLAYAVTQRRHEFGVRVALGAGAGAVVRLVVGEGARVALAGVAIGAAAALLAGKALAPLLFQTSPRDPLVFGGVALTLLAVAVAASALPAWSAARTDPLRTLKAE